jgi:2TM domain
VFSVFFFLLDMVTAGGEWFFFPVLGWGVGVAAHAVKYFFPVEPSPEERARRLHRMQKRLRRYGDPALEQALEEGVSLLLTRAEQRTGAPACLRVAGAPDAPDAPNASDIGAEAEAAAAEEALRAKGASRRARRSG